jgi:hypothetical protein
MANEFLQWLAALEREFVFLLALPFVVAVVGLWSWWNDKEQVDREYEQSEQRERRTAERRKAERRQGGSRITA